MLRIPLKNETETIALGKCLGRFLNAGDLIVMEGDLGAGKTTMTKGIGEALGVTKVINSPTFTILKVYQGRLPLYHFDVYRLEGNDDDLGFDEYFEGDGVCVVEWAQFLGDQLPKHYLRIQLNHQEDGRMCELEGVGGRYQELEKEVSHAISCD